MLSFKDFLLQEAEINVSLDTDDPAGSLNKAKEMLRRGKSNPQAAIKQRQKNLMMKSKEAKAAGDTDERKIADMEQRVAKLKQADAAEKERKQV